MRKQLLKVLKEAIRLYTIGTTAVNERHLQVIATSAIRYLTLLKSDVERSYFDTAVPILIAKNLLEQTCPMFDQDLKQKILALRDQLFVIGRKSYEDLTRIEDGNH